MTRLQPIKDQLYIDGLVSFDELELIKDSLNRAQIVYQASLLPNPPNDFDEEEE